MRWLQKLFRKDRHLETGVDTVIAYSMIIQEEELPRWQKLGWKQMSAFPYLSQRYRPNNGEVVIVKKPSKLSQSHGKNFIGKKLARIYANYGTYGLSGAGFFGFEVKNDDRDLAVENDTLVFAVRGSATYTVIDDRVVFTYPSYSGDLTSWAKVLANEVSPYDTQLTLMMEDAEIIDVTTKSDLCIFTTLNNGNKHTIKMLKYGENIPPHEINEFTSHFHVGEISDYILLINKNATLWAK